MIKLLIGITGIQLLPYGYHARMRRVHFLSH